MWSSQGGEAAVDSGGHGRDGRSDDFGQLLEGEVFLEAKDEGFAINGFEGGEGLGEAVGVLGARGLLERRGCGRDGGWDVLLGIVVILGVEREDAAFAQGVDGEVAGDGEEPGFEAGLAVVGASALEHTEPGFLHQVIDQVAAADYIDEVADEAVLILRDECVEKSDIPMTQAARDLLGVGVYGARECHVRRPHTQGIRGKGVELRIWRRIA